MCDLIFSCDYEDAISGRMRGAMVPNRIAELEALVARLTEQLAGGPKVEPNPIFRAIRRSRG